MQILSRAYWREVFSPAMILQTTMQTIIGTVLVGSFFMVCSDYVFQPVDMTGRWEMVLRPASAMRLENRCVDISYNVLFTQEGTTLGGGGEKAKDRKSASPDCRAVDIFERDIAPGKGNRIEVSGHVQNNYLAQDSLVLSYEEGDGERLRFTVANLEVVSDDEMLGWYQSSISRTDGVVVLKRVK